MGSSEKEYLEVVRNNPEEYPGPNELFEDHFEFQSLSYSVYRRFIELLYPASNHFFRKTSKHNYQQCLDVRGIEVEKLCWSDYDEPHGELSFRSGKMRLNLDIVPTNWTKFLVVTGSVYFAHPRSGPVPDMKKLAFVKKNTELFFYNGFAEQLECLIHPILREVYIKDYYLEFDYLLRCLNKLNACNRLESFDIINYYNVKSAAAFKQVKQQLEVLATCQPDAQIDCNLGYKKVFKIHENVLCHTPEPGVFVKDYHFDDL